ncbi:adenylate/guanylate cyclase domain-containing protein [Allocoleopsis sp.]|uniref:adenylate/guanylate cyclase domain-containing protein n=1 Tax=Allocoleopsis sp. TaxID=3088169 RepID=UPI002FD36C79
MAEFKLRLQLQGDVEKTVRVNRDEFVVGRLPVCDLHLPFLEISRHHSRFVKTEIGTWLIEDLGSTNGTRLNEKLILSPQPIKDGDVVHLGSIYLKIMLAEHSQQNEVGIKLPTQEIKTYGNAKELQERWIEADNSKEDETNYQTAISRLKDLVDIAKNLNSAVSIEAIFSQVKQIVFRNLPCIERLALLVDVQGSGKLQVLNAAVKDISEQLELTMDANWISRTICQKVFTEKVAIKTADAQTDERFDQQQSISDKGIRSALAVPVWDNNLVVGVLYADACIHFNPWSQGGDEDLSFFSALGNIVASAVQRWRLIHKLRSEEAIRQRLERYHSPGVVQHIMAEGVLEEGRLKPIEADISVLFADLVGFTALSQRLSPRQIAQLLNSLFEEMLKEIFAAGGTLDKFIGDCIMAFFGAPKPQSDHADRALRAAKRMLYRLDRLNACRTFCEPLQLRIAINSGKAIVGDVGSSQRVDYTVLGTTINLASRMQHICLPGECVVSEATFARLARKQGLVEMKHYRFKGINQPVLIYQTKRLSNKTLSSKSSHLKSSHLLTVVPSRTYHSSQDNQR